MWLRGLIERETTRIGTVPHSSLPLRSQEDIHQLMVKSQFLRWEDFILFYFIFPEMSDSTQLKVSASGFVWSDDWIETAVLQCSCHVASDIFLFFVCL